MGLLTRGEFYELLDRGFGYRGDNLLAVDLLQYQRYHQYQGWLDLGQSLHKELRSGEFPKQSNVGTGSQGNQHIERTPVGMGQGKECQGTRSLIVKIRTDTEDNIATQIIVRKHYTLGESRSAGGIVDFGYGILCDFGILYVGTE